MTKDTHNKDFATRLSLKEAEINSEMDCASSVADVAQGGEPSQLQTQMKQRVASILLSNITYPILFLQIPVSKAKQI